MVGVFEHAITQRIVSRNEEERQRRMAVTQTPMGRYGTHYCLFDILLALCHVVHGFSLQY